MKGDTAGTAGAATARGLTNAEHGSPEYPMGFIGGYYGRGLFDRASSRWDYLSTVSCRNGWVDTADKSRSVPFVRDVPKGVRRFEQRFSHRSKQD